MAITIDQMIDTVTPSTGNYTVVGEIVSSASVVSNTIGNGVTIIVPSDYSYVLVSYINILGTLSVAGNMRLL